jgi:hypothetical protein
MFHRVAFLKTILFFEAEHHIIYKYVLFHCTSFVQHKLCTALQDMSSFPAQQQQFPPACVYCIPQTVCAMCPVCVAAPLAAAIHHDGT